MKPLHELLDLTKQYLNNRKDAENLICHALKLKRIDLYSNFDRPTTDEEMDTLRPLIKERKQGKPLAYILGSVPFYNTTIQVTEDVLIPRVETEILVQTFIESNSDAKHVLDLCCGSGCIGIAIKKACPHLEVTLSDISQKACDLATRNAQLNQVDVHVIQGDFLIPKTVEAIICNPPYVTYEEYETLDPQVKNYEPKLALVAEDEGLYFYKKLKNTTTCPLFLEIGSTQKEAIQTIFPKCQVIKDYAQHDRVVVIDQNT